MRPLTCGVKGKTRQSAMQVEWVYVRDGKARVVRFDVLFGKRGGI